MKKAYAAKLSKKSSIRKLGILYIVMLNEYGQFVSVWCKARVFWSNKKQGQMHIWGIADKFLSFGEPVSEWVSEQQGRGESQMC